MLTSGCKIRLNIRGDEADIELLDPDGANIELHSEFGVSPLNEAITEAKHHAAVVDA